MTRKVRIRICRHRHMCSAEPLALALLAALLLTTLVWVRHSAASSLEAARDYAEMGALPQAPLSYYLTKGTYNGANVDGSDGNGAGVCAAGYHFASMWEILDTSNHKYNTTLGYTQADSGQGPPAGVAGWVRTGYSSSISSTPGTGNCITWSSDSSSNSGTLVRLPSTWNIVPDTGIWGVGSATCDTNVRVWCVADRAGSTTFLPLILND